MFFKGIKTTIISWACFTFLALLLPAAILIIWASITAFCLFVTHDTRTRTTLAGPNQGKRFRFLLTFRFIKAMSFLNGIISNQAGNRDWAEVIKLSLMQPPGCSKGQARKPKAAHSRMGHTRPNATTHKDLSVNLVGVRQARAVVQSPSDAQGTRNGCR
jgi:hypothetical protein